MKTMLSFSIGLVMGFVIGFVIGYLLAAEKIQEPMDEEEGLSKAPSSQLCSEILEEMKDDDYYNYCRTGYSRFSEDDWDFLIRNAQDKERLHERFCQQADSDQCS